MPGFGGTYGGVPWGGQEADAALDPVLASESIGVSEGVHISPAEPAQVAETLTSSAAVVLTYGQVVTVQDTLAQNTTVAALDHVRVTGALSINAYRVQVDFTIPLDPNYIPNTLAANYVIPGLTVSAVILDPTGLFVTLTTSAQTTNLYTVTVQQAQDPSGLVLDPAFRTAQFFGYSAGSYIGAAQSTTKVVLLFSSTLGAAGPTQDAANYRVWDLLDQPIGVVSATLSGPTPYVRVTLQLAQALEPLAYYVVKVGAAVQSDTGRAYVPDTQVIQCPRGPDSYALPFALFSGEVNGGLLGTPAGQVFFSPALEFAVQGSEIEVEEVKCCTKAFDSYVVPRGIDLAGPALMTWGAQIPDNTLFSGIHQLESKTWAPFPCMGDASLNIADNRSDSLAVPVSGRAVAVLAEVLDPSRGSRTNGFWTTGPAGGANRFIIADNLTPIGPGSSQTIVLAT